MTENSLNSPFFARQGLRGARGKQKPRRLGEITESIKTIKGKRTDLCKDNSEVAKTEALIPDKKNENQNVQTKHFDQQKTKTASCGFDNVKVRTSDTTE